jgi:hypothetical protein
MKTVTMKIPMNMLALATAILALVVSTYVIAQAPPSVKMVQKTETFDRDPGWDAYQNRIKVPAVKKQQNFGWSNTNHCGAGAGEIGGVVWRSISPAYYGKKVGPFNFDTPLTASGTITCLKSNTGKGWQTGSTIYVGFFNRAEQGWRPINYMGYRLEVHTDTKAQKIENRPYVELGYGTSKWEADGITANARGEGQAKNPLELDQDALQRVPPDNSKHTWELRYDPKGGERGMGEITLIFDGNTTKCGLRKWHREHGATFDRFGIFNNQVCGDFIEVYLDDITINGEKTDFATDPKWDEKGNRDLVIDSREYGAQDFGFSQTQHAGGAKAGELGGLFQSVDPWEKNFMGYYGDRVGPLNLDHKLVAKGKFASNNEYSIDSTMAIGWFNSENLGWPMKNFVGVFFDSLSDTGRIITPLYGTSDGSNGSGNAKWLMFMPDGRSYDWALEYDPTGEGGRGVIKFTLNGETTTHPLDAGDRKKGATFNRFGVFNLGGANSKHCVIWFDDLTYTIRAE